jgi:adenine-specific DNA-methyltransferase
MNNLELLENLFDDFSKCIINSNSCNIDLVYDKYLTNINRSDEGYSGYIHQTMMTMMGNKRKLLNNLEEILLKIKEKENKKKLNIFDAFCGTTVCSRLFTKHASKLYTNDLEKYSYLMAKAFLEKPRYSQQVRINNHIDKMNCIAENGPYIEGIMCENYSPKNTKDIKKGERCFYTRENALIIDTLRKYIEDNVESDIFHYCITPLLIKMTINVNCILMKGFYKDKKTGIGAWGGSAGDDTSRITKPIRLDKITWLNPVDVKCFNEDSNELVNQIKFVI